MSEGSVYFSTLDNDNAEGRYNHINLMYGGVGNDTLRGANLNDTLYGGGHNDLLQGRSGNDTLYGGSGRDQLQGEIGNDLLFGDVGDDKLFGDSGNDTLDGGAGNDSLFGGEGNDDLYGDSGNDLLIGGGGRNFMWGGNGRDTIIGASGSTDIVYVSHFDSEYDVIRNFNYAEGDRLSFGAGGALNYRLTRDGDDALIYRNSGSDNNNLVAVLENVSNSTMASLENII